jgi:hypothetical protein
MPEPIVLENQPMQTLAGTAPPSALKNQLGGIGFMLAMTVCFFNPGCFCKIRNP